MKVEKIDSKATPGPIIKTVAENAEKFEAQAVLESGTVKCYEDSIK